MRRRPVLPGRGPAGDGDAPAASDRAARVHHAVTLENRGGIVLQVAEDEAVIDVAEAAGLRLPIGCRYGGCITCAAKLLDGRVRQPGATALNRRQSRAGYVLLCVARPRTPLVLEVGVESHDRLYENPFAVARPLDRARR